jgi:hypothetical protein
MNLLVSLLSLLVFADHPKTSFTTSAGYTFSYVQDPKLGRALQAPEGKLWTTYQGQFTNVGPRKNAELMDSAAMRHCASLGAELPRAGDLLSLRAYFEVEDDYERLTDRAAGEFTRLFGLPEYGLRVWSRTRSMPPSEVTDTGSYMLEVRETGVSFERASGSLESVPGTLPGSVICVRPWPQPKT